LRSVFFFISSFALLPAHLTCPRRLLPCPPRVLGGQPTPPPNPNHSGAAPRRAAQTCLDPLQRLPAEAAVRWLRFRAQVPVGLCTQRDPSTAVRRSGSGGSCRSSRRSAPLCRPTASCPWPTGSGTSGSASRSRGSTSTASCRPRRRRRRPSGSRTRRCPRRASRWRRRTRCCEPRGWRRRVRGFGSPASCRTPTSCVDRVELCRSFQLVVSSHDWESARGAGRNG
jgi:hypothetical protein